VSTLEAAPPSSITNQFASDIAMDQQHFVLSNGRIIPLVAGFGVVVETVVTGNPLPLPQFLRVSARPWAAGRVSQTATVISSTGRHAFTVSGAFGTGLRIGFPSHPDGQNYTTCVTPRTIGILNASYEPISAGECAFFFRNVSGVQLNTEFCFVVH